MSRGGGIRRKGWLLKRKGFLKGSKQRVRGRDRNLLRLTREPHCLNSFSTWRQGLFNGMSTESVALVLGRTEKDLF